MTLWVPPYEPSDHEIEIRKMFQPVDSGARPPFPVGRTLMICFTNRSGSNFLSHALASTGSVKPAREYLNHPVVRRRSERLGIDSFDAYLRQIADEFGHHGILTLKAGHRQLLFLARLGFLEDLLASPIFILIERADLVGQAVSWLIAFQSGRWTSEHEGKDEYTYDPDAIRSRIDGLERENRGFKEFFERNDLPFRLVEYEDLAARPAETVATLAHELDLYSEAYDAGRVRIEKQSSDLNLQWKNRYLNEL